MSNMQPTGAQKNESEITAAIKDRDKAGRWLIFFTGMASSAFAGLIVSAARIAAGTDNSTTTVLSLVFFVVGAIFMVVNALKYIEARTDARDLTHELTV